MSYTAKHYVKISGRKYTPGEIIDIPIPEEKLKRLLRLKAIECAHDAIDDPTDDNADGNSDDGAEETHNNYARGAALESLIRPSAFSPETGENFSPDRTETLQPDNLGYDPSGNPKEAPDEEETAEEADEEVEAPEIDVMDGIVSAAEEPAEEAPPKKTTSKGRKNA